MGKSSFKRFVVFLLLVTSFIVLIGCTSRTVTGGIDGSTVDNYPEKPIRLIVTNAPGGSLDITIRNFASFAQKEMGPDAVITVENIEGGANWNGWYTMMKAEPDGYTLSNIHTPHVFSYLNKSLKNDTTLEDFNLLCNIVTDIGLVAVRADDTRFENVNSVKELANVIKSYDGELLAGLTSVGGDDHIAYLKLIKQLGLGNLVGVNYKGVAENKAAILGGHVDLYFGNVGDSLSSYEDGELKIIATFSEERSEFLPDIPTVAEEGFEIYSGSSRGIVAQPSMSNELKEKILSYFRATAENPEFLEHMKNSGFEVNYLEGEEYEAFMKSIEQDIISFSDELGYN